LTVRPVSAGLPGGRDDCQPWACVLVYQACYLGARNEKPLPEFHTLYLAIVGPPPPRPTAHAANGLGFVDTQVLCLNIANLHWFLLMLIIALGRVEWVIILMQLAFIRRIKLYLGVQVDDGQRHDKIGESKFGQGGKMRLLGKLLNDERDRRWGSLAQPEIAKKYEPNAIRRANAEFTRFLRALADQWIDSGKKSGGTESPLSRDVNAVPAGCSVPLFDLLQAWLERNRPQPKVMRGSGKITVPVRLPSLGDREPEFYARECAVFWFQELLLESPYSFHLSRCSNPGCRVYYFRSRLLKVEFKRSAYCGKCVGAGSVERTRRSREARKNNLVSLAADSWSAWTSTGRGLGRQSEWVARNMNKKLRSDLRVTGKWVSQNRSDIEKEVERRKRAKD